MPLYLKPRKLEKIEEERSVVCLRSPDLLTDDGRAQKEFKKLAKSHPLVSFPQHTSAASAQTDRAPGTRTTTPKPALSNLIGRPPMPAPDAANPTPPEHTPTDLSQKRGKKRELEESAMTVTPQQNHRQATPPASVVIGTNGVKPRPMKKQRVVRYPLCSRVVT